MRSIHQSCSGILALVVALGGLGHAAAQETFSGSVEEMRRLLKMPSFDPAARDRDVKKAMAGLRDITEFRQALVLQEWRDDDIDAAVIAVDYANRSTVASQFGQAVREVLRTRGVNGQLAVVNMLAEMGTSSRGLRTKNGLLRGFGPDLAHLMKHADPVVREVAARTLGRIDPEPEVAVPALSGMLNAAQANERLAAAEGLVSLMRIVATNATRSRSTTEVEATRADVVRVGCAVIPVVARGLGDGQVEVRRRCAETFEQVAQVLGKLASQQRLGTSEPDGTGSEKTVAAERAELLPVVLAMNSQGTVLFRALEDKDAEVRLLARRTLEDLAKAPAASEPGTTPATGTGSIFPAEYNPSSQAGAEVVNASMRAKVPALAAAITSKDVRERREAIDMLETLGSSAMPAVQALVKALTDRDRFVRWAAARTLGKLGPVELGTTVPGLAKLLADSDLDVRLTAASSLEHYGPAARAAVPELIQAVSAADPEVRVATIRALGSIGPESRAAVPALRTALSDPDERVRQTSARALARLGPVAHDACDALRKALTDSSSEVRKAASDALLATQAKRPNG